MLALVPEYRNNDTTFSDTGGPGLEHSTVLVISAAVDAEDGAVQEVERFSVERPQSYLVH